MTCCRVQVFWPSALLPSETSAITIFSTWFCDEIAQDEEVGKTLRLRFSQRTCSNYLNKTALCVSRPRAHQNSQRIQGTSPRTFRASRAPPTKHTRKHLKSEPWANPPSANGPRCTNSACLPLVEPLQSSSSVRVQTRPPTEGQGI